MTDRLRDRMILTMKTNLICLSIVYHSLIDRLLLHINLYLVKLLAKSKYCIAADPTGEKKAM